MSRTRFRLTVISLACIAILLSSACLLGAEDKSVEPTHSGKVAGHVYDAETGAPVEGAVVVAQQEGAFADKGETIGKTDASGSYKCEAELGRVSSNIDVGRLLNSSLIGALLTGSAKKVTKRIDISRLNLRVSRDGYHDYEGVVACRSVDPESFSVAMEPILLTRAESSEASTTAQGWGVANIVDVTVEPSILKPKAEATVTVHIKCPPVPKSTKIGVIVNSHSLGNKELKLVPAADPAEIVFSGKFSAPNKAVTEQGKSVV